MCGGGGETVAVGVVEDERSTLNSNHLIYCESMVVYHYGLQLIVLPCLAANSQFMLPKDNSTKDQNFILFFDDRTSKLPLYNSLVEKRSFLGYWGLLKIKRFFK